MPHNSILIANLPYSLGETGGKRMLSQARDDLGHWDIRAIYFCKWGPAGVFSGRARVDFQDAAEMEGALELLNAAEFMGRRLFVARWRPRALRVSGRRNEQAEGAEHA